MFLLVNFNPDLTSLPLPLSDTNTESLKEVNLNASVLEAASEPLVHLARFVANFLSETEGESKSLANTCVVTVQPPAPAPAAKQHSMRQEQGLPDEDADGDKPGLDYNRLGEQLLLAAGLGSPEVFEQLPLPFTTPTSTDKLTDYDYEWGFEAKAEAEAEVGVWNDRGPVVIIPPSDPVLSMFIGHALTHLLQAGDIWSPVYILTDPFSPTPKLVQWD